MGGARVPPAQSVRAIETREAQGARRRLPSRSSARQLPSGEDCWVTNAHVLPGRPAQGDFLKVLRLPGPENDATSSHGLNRSGRLVTSPLARAGRPRVVS